jgi:hypothetical protein
LAPEAGEVDQELQKSNIDDHGEEGEAQDEDETEEVDVPI